MKTIRFISISFLLVSTLLMNIIFCSNGNIPDRDLAEPIFKEEPSQREIKHHKDQPNHLVLIYDGGKHRSVRWTQEHFAPYVSAKAEGSEKWLFDGFLFLEIKDGMGRGFASGYEKLAARKIEWENLLKNYFTEGNAIYALDKQIETVLKSGQIKEQFEKRKIVLSLPEPIPSQTDWGMLDGRPLLFTNKKDRLDACKWYIEYAEEMFHNANFAHVELVGFYWLAEEATNSRDLAGDVADYVYGKQYDFYWIPYFNSDGYTEWEQLGFNSVYYQPNYFFNENISYSRLQEACDRSKKHHMNMEVEFDDNVLKNNKNWGYRLRDYLDVYENNGVFDSLKVAYYQGGDTFYKLSKSEEESDKSLYRRLVDLITKNDE